MHIYLASSVSTLPFVYLPPTYCFVNVKSCNHIPYVPIHIFPAHLSRRRLPLSSFCSCICKSSCSKLDLPPCDTNPNVGQNAQLNILLRLVICCQSTSVAQFPTSAVSHSQSFPSDRTVYQSPLYLV